MGGGGVDRKRLLVLLLAAVAGEEGGLTSTITGLHSGVHFQQYLSLSEKTQVLTIKTLYRSVTTRFS